MIRWIVRQKYRFDLGASVLQIATFAIVVDSKLQILTGISQTRYLMIAGAGIGVCGVWLCGIVLDALGYASHYADEQNARNSAIQKLLNKS